MARAARAVASQTHRNLQLTLALAPSQFAGGREFGVVSQWGLFDRILDPQHCLRLALGLGSLTVAERAAVVHLGGDLWISARLARRLRSPACAFAETILIARRHTPFARVFATSETIAERLAAAGVPRHKIVVSGDPRCDAFADEDRGESRASQRSGPALGGHYTLAMLPGSRDSFFQLLIPYFLQVANALAPIHPEMMFQIAVSPFLSPPLVTQFREEVARAWPRLRVEWVSDHLWTALARSDLVLTIPGTNTLELAMAGIPFAVLLPTHRVDALPAEGVLEWVGRIPGLGRLIKELALPRYLASRPFLALPNIRAGRIIVPELVGRWTPTEVANRLADLLRHPEERATMATALRQLYGGTSGAATVVATQAFALAESQEAPR